MINAVLGDTLIVRGISYTLIKSITTFTSLIPIAIDL